MRTFTFERWTWKDAGRVFRAQDSRQKIGTAALVLMGCFVCGVVGSGYLEKPNPFPIEQDESAAVPLAQVPAPDTAPPAVGRQISINAATVQELDTLPGIGPVIAQRIVDYRKMINGFKSVEELKAVNGIGDTRFAKILPYIKL